VYDDAESAEGEADEKDCIEVAGRTFLTAKLQIPLPGETAGSIEKMRSALRGMWMGTIPRTYGIKGEPKTPMGPGPGMGFGDVPGPEEPRGGTKGGRETQGGGHGT